LNLDAIMTTKEEQIAQLRRAFENGIIDATTYKNATGSSALQIKGSQVAVVGDRPTIHGGVNFYGSKEDPEGLMRRYLTDLAAETNLLPWGRISPEEAGPAEESALRLADVYTALDTTAPERMDSEDDLRRRLSRPERMPRIPVQQMINDHDRLVLLGDPGSGKTTVVNFITHAMACAGLADDPQACLPPLLQSGPWNHGPLFPIRVVLREVGAWLASDEATAATIGAWIRMQLKAAGLEELWPRIHEGLQDRKRPFLILLDGLDEVSADHRKLQPKIPPQPPSGHLSHLRLRRPHLSSLPLPTHDPGAL
jgi:hypothetical protein